MYCLCKDDGMAIMAIVLSPDLIWRVYRFQYNTQELRAVLKAIRAGVGFGSGTETIMAIKVYVMFNNALRQGRMDKTVRQY